MTHELYSNGRIHQKKFHMTFYKAHSNLSAKDTFLVPLASYIYVRTYSAQHAMHFNL